MTALPSLSLLNEISQFIQRGKFSFSKKGIFSEWEKFSPNYDLFLLSWKSGLRVNEAISFDFHLKHPRHKNLYLVKGKGQKKRYVYVSKEIIQKLKSNHWKPNQTNRINFYNFLQKTKQELGISKETELTPHTLRRCFTTYRALNGVPMPVLQKALGHKNIRTTSFYWKGSVDIREFGEWLETGFSPREPEEVPKDKTDDGSQLPKSPQIPTKLENPSPTKEPELLKTIEKLKGELVKKDLIIAEKDNQLQNKDNEISLLTTENQKLKAINHQKDRKLKELREKIRKLETRANSLIENSINLKNAAKNQGKRKVNNNQILTEPPKEKGIGKISLNSEENLSNALSEIKEPKNNSLTVKEKDQTELVSEIQVWKKK